MEAFRDHVGPPGAENRGSKRGLENDAVENHPKCGAEFETRARGRLGPGSTLTLWKQRSSPGRIKEG